MKNILNFPEQTFLGRIVPKNTFYRHLDVNTKMKQHFVDDVSSITWLYKLSASVLNVEDGKEVNEIVVFHVVLKQKECPNDVFLFIDKNMPRHVVFLLQYEEEYRLLLNYKEWQNKAEGKFSIIRSFATEWMPLTDIKLPLDGLSMDRIYENMAGALSGYGTANREDTKLFVEKETALAKMMKQAEALQKKVRLEKQINRQMEMNSEARALKRSIAALRAEIEQLKSKN